MTMTQKTPVIAFGELAFRNFMSYGNNWTTFDLSQENLSHFLQGVNRDATSENGGNGANGVGKTTMLNALCWICYGEAFDKISSKKLQNNKNKKSKNCFMEGRVEIKRDGIVYTIHRTLKSSSDIAITKLDANGHEEDCTKDSISECDRFIAEDILGISFELFKNVVVFSGGNEPFLSKRPAEQKELLEELFDQKILTDKAIKLKKKIDATNVEISIQEAIFKEKQSTVFRYSRQVDEATNRVLLWEENKEKKIQKLTEELEEAKKVAGIDFSQEQKIHEALATTQFEIQKVKAGIAELENLKRNDTKKLEEISSQIKKVKEAVCPFCNQQMHDTEEKLKSLTSTEEQLTSKIQEISLSIRSSMDHLSTLTETAQKLADQRQYANLNTLVQLQQNISKIENDLSATVKSENPHLESLDSLLRDPVQDDSNTEKLDELKKALEHRKMLYKLLTDKNSFLRRKIVGSQLSLLNTQINVYTKQLGLPHTVEFDDNMTCQVSEFDTELDYGQLSNGEKKRVNLALSMAFRDVMNIRHCKFRFLFVDEIDSGIDTSGIESVIKMLKDRTKNDGLNLWVVMHRTEAHGRFDRNVKVIKEFGFSRIEIDD